MKRLLLALLLALSAIPAYAGPYDITTDQRNSTDTAYVRRFYTTPSDGKSRIQYFDAGTMLPGYLSVGPGLAITGTVLDTTSGGGITQVPSDWSASTGVARILNKPTLFSGAYVDLTGKPTLFSGNYVDLLGKPTLFSGAYADLSGKPSYASVATTGAYADLTGQPVLFSGAYADLTGKPALFSGSYIDLSNKPTIPSAQVASDWSASTGVAVILNKPTLFSGAYTDLTGKPTIPAAQVQSDWSAVSGLGVVLNKPTLFSGSYTDLTNKPTIPAAQVNADWSSSSGVSQVLNKPILATVATSGSYVDLSNKPTIPTIVAFNYGTPVARTVAVGTAYQATTNTKAANVTLTLTCPTSLTLSGGVTCVGEVRIGPTSASVAAAGSGGFAVGPYQNTLTGGLVVGVSINSSNYETKTISLPTGWFFSVLQTSGTGLSVVAAFDQTAG